MTLDEALLVLTTKLLYLPNALTLALDINLHIVLYIHVLVLHVVATEYRRYAFDAFCYIDCHRTNRCMHPRIYV